MKIQNKIQLHLFLMALGLILNFALSEFQLRTVARDLVSNQYKQLYVEDGVGVLPVNLEEIQLDFSFFLFLSFGFVFFVNQTQLSFFKSSIFCFKKNSFHLIDIPPPAINL
jgi:hypothetical protein